MSWGQFTTGTPRRQDDYVPLEPYGSDQEYYYAVADLNSGPEVEEPPDIDFKHCRMCHKDVHWSDWSEGTCVVEHKWGPPVLDCTTQIKYSFAACHTDGDVYDGVKMDRDEGNSFEGARYCYKGPHVAGYGSPHDTRHNSISKISCCYELGCMRGKEFGKYNADLQRGRRDEVLDSRQKEWREWPVAADGIPVVCVVGKRKRANVLDYETYLETLYVRPPTIEALKLRAILSGPGGPFERDAINTFKTVAVFAPVPSGNETTIKPSIPTSHVPS
ncbi:hypothetical protein FRC01_002533 [Tulasnella sp. 417]|nr:hypothetical protein FRC01_002533 [Tulasnella sp. 417]